MLGTPAAQEIDSDPNPTDAEILRELYPPRAGRPRAGASCGASFARAAAARSPTTSRCPAATTDAQVAAEDPWLRSDRNYIQLAGIGAPTLAAAGRRDPVVPPVNLRRIAARVPGAELRVFAGAHAFLFGDRRRFADAVDDFLAQP